jgi:hypothetical protein
MSTTKFELFEREFWTISAGFAWKDEGVQNINDKLWHQLHYEKLVEFKRNYGHCIVPTKHEQDKSPGEWVGQAATASHQ